MQYGLGKKEKAIELLEKCNSLINTSYYPIKIK